MRLTLWHGRVKLLDIPVQSEQEYFKINYQLQCNIKGTAHSYLFHRGCIVHSVKLGEKPVQIFNSAKDEWQPFIDFYNNPQSFSHLDRMKYAFWIKDKMYEGYGFF